MEAPTILVVPGAMHCPEHYKPLTRHLEGLGHRCIIISLPSTQNTSAPPAGLADDTDAIRSAVLHELNNEKNDVLVLAHSYGGVPANNALQSLDTKSRSEDGHAASVKALAFMCSLAIRAGLSAASFIASRSEAGVRQGKSSVDMDSTGAFGIPKSSPGAEEALFNDLPAEEAKKWAGLLRPISIRVMGEDTSYAAYTDIPTGYLYCSKDETLPLAAQEFVVAEAKKAGATIIHEDTVDAGHSPFLSKIAETTSFILKLIEMVS